MMALNQDKKGSLMTLNDSEVATFFKDGFV
jgi:hypothetical protein